MKTLSIDIETFSSVDLNKCGVYKYSESPDFQILLFGYSVDGGKVQVVDLAKGEKIPAEIIDALTDEKILKWAYNANFERVCLSRLFKNFLSPESWRCTMIWAAYLGLPFSLANVGKVLGLEKQKLSEGKNLIKYFCTPNKNGERNLPDSVFYEWENFKNYNRRDVEVELAIQKRLEKFPVPDFIWKEYALDQKVNDRGILIDGQFVKNAIEFDKKSREKLESSLKKITKIENPNSVLQMKNWLAENGLETETLGKKEVAELLKAAPEPLKKVLTLRQQISKSSVKKYLAMENTACKDGRARGMFQFYGANRTGRFSGRNIQLQNLPQNHLSDLENARTLVKIGDYKTFETLYDSVPEVLSELIRTAFVPKDGKKFIVADFSAIEARVLSWLANEKWRMEVFAKNGDIYCETASRMFHCKVEKHGENKHLRQKGKQAELACIAEGQLVLTDKGLIPIEQITTEHKLWDGEEWVSHEGVIFKGEREVITYEGLTATPDHLVWIEGQPKPVYFGIAAACGTHLVQTGNGGTAIRMGENYQSGEMLEDNKCTARLYDIRNAGKHHRFTVSGKLVHNCGYGGSVGALKAFGALESGMKEEELKPMVDAWRAANPNIVQFWYDTDEAAITCVKEHTTTETHGLKFIFQSGMMFIELPSGRRLSYVKPQIEKNRFGGESITYRGLDATKNFSRLETYGAKLTENITQAISRDILCHAMKNFSDIVAHVHDEIIIECDKNISVKEVCEKMSQTPEWADGLILHSDGFECEFYKKD